MIRIKRVYSQASHDDGVRILVDRVWPRGVRKQQAKVDEWRRELAPSTALRKWFRHDPAKWDTFRERYRRELLESGGMDELNELARRARRETITLLYGAADERHNQAVAIKEILDDL
jgi:uncharacterized protein YeaO (DUF488 family)